MEAARRNLTGELFHFRKSQALQVLRIAPAQGLTQGFYCRRQVGIQAAPAVTSDNFLNTCHGASGPNSALASAHSVANVFVDAGSYV